MISLQANEKAIPLDVKEGRGSLNSLEKFRIRNGTGPALKISSNNYGFDASKNLLTIPLYEMPFLAEDISAGKLMEQRCFADIPF